MITREEFGESFLFVRVVLISALRGLGPLWCQLSPYSLELKYQAALLSEGIHFARSEV